MNLIYWFNIVALLGAFVMSVMLFFELFALDSLAYTLQTVPRSILKLFIVMLCVGQLHALEGDNIKEIDLHDLLRDIGQFGLIFFTHLYIRRRRQKQTKQ
jgi:uncharacterized membrane protein